MPLWKIYHPVGAFTREDKHELSKRVTDIYRILPKFYVSVIFQEVAEDSFFIGGEPTNKFVRIWMDHIARQFSSDKARASFIEAANRALEPFVKDRGLDWEFHIDETPIELWSIQGFRPPMPGTPDEQRWKAENKASPRTHE